MLNTSLAVQTKNYFNPTLTDWLLEHSAVLPGNSCVLGIATSDGLPVMMDLWYDLVEPTLVFAPKEYGVTNLLRTAYHTAIYNKRENSLVEHYVLTRKLNEWSKSKNIIPLYDTVADDFILGLASWIHNERRKKNKILLIIDDFDYAVTHLDINTLSNLNYLFQHSKEGITILCGARQGNRLESETIKIDWMSNFYNFIVGPSESIFVPSTNQKNTFWYLDDILEFYTLLAE